MVRDVTPRVSGFPGLPAWLDKPLCGRLAEALYITPEEASERLFDKTEKEVAVILGNAYKMKTIIQEEFNGVQSRRAEKGKSGNYGRGIPREEDGVFPHREPLSAEPEEIGIDDEGPSGAAG